MKIVIKESDRLKSLLHKDRVISEYLIYLVDNGITLKCYNLIGDEAKKAKISELLLMYFGGADLVENNLNLNEIIEEIDLEEFLKKK